jgi:protein-disulfide isomerase
MKFAAISLVALFVLSATPLHAADEKKKEDSHAGHNHTAANKEMTPEQKAAYDKAAAEAKVKEQEMLKKIANLTREDVLKPGKNEVMYGDKNAPITMIEYASYSCNHCADFYKKIFSQIQNKYIDTGKVKFYYRDFPLNEPAMRAAMLVRCAPEKMRKAYVKTIYNTQEKWAFEKDFKEKLANVAKLGGMKQEDFNKCMENKKIEDEVLLSGFKAAKVLEMTSTPTVFINGELDQSHDFAAIEKRVDELLAKAKKD